MERHFGAAKDTRITYLLKQTDVYRHSCWYAGKVGNICGISGNLVQLGHIKVTSRQQIQKTLRVLDKCIPFSRRRPYPLRLQAKDLPDEIQCGGNLAALSCGSPSTRLSCSLFRSIGYP